MTDLLVESALRSLLCAAVVGLGLTVFRVRNVPVRKAAWTVVLLAAISMPWLMTISMPSVLRLDAAWVLPMRGLAASAEQVFAPAPPVQVPVQRSAKSAEEQPGAWAEREQTGASSIAALPVVDGELVADSAAAAPARRSFHWPPAGQMILWTYLAVAGVLLLRLLLGLAAAVRLWMTAAPVSPLVSPEPNVRVSAGIPAPVTVGSGIVLPADYAGWDRSKLRMVIAHERSHVRQMDFYLQLLAGLYTAVFWFSPLGWWLRHVLCSLGEAIGDRAGMEAAGNRSRYAETLLEIAALPHGTLPGVAMARSANLSRRVESMLNEGQLRRAFVEGRMRAAASLVVIPVALFVALAVVRAPSAAAQSAQQPTPPPQTDSQQPKATTGQSNPPEEQVTTTKASPEEQQNTPAPAVPAPPAGPGTTQVPEGQSATPPAPPAPGGPDGVAAPALPAVPSAGPAAPEAPPMAEEDGQSTTTYYGKDSRYRFGTRRGAGYEFRVDGDSYAIVTGAGKGMTFSGNWNSDQQAELDKARHAANGPFLWFRHEGKSYIVTDPSIIAVLQKMYAPMQELGKQQEALGRQQRALGKQQEELGREQREAGTIEVPDMSKAMAEMNAAVARMKENQPQWDAQKWAQVEAELQSNQKLTQEQMGEIQSHLGAMMAQLAEQRAEVQSQLAEMQARLGALQGQAGARMGAFGEKMGALGRQQGELGRQQGRLGREQGRLGRELNREVQRIIQQSLANGKAKPVQ